MFTMTRDTCIYLSVAHQKTWRNFHTSNFGSQIAAFRLLMDRQFLLLCKSSAWALGFESLNHGTHSTIFNDTD